MTPCLIFSPEASGGMAKRHGKKKGSSFQTVSALFRVRETIFDTLLLFWEFAFKSTKSSLHKSFRKGLTLTNGFCSSSFEEKSFKLLGNDQVIFHAKPNNNKYFIGNVIKRNALLCII